ncbi:unnamed protein product [Symbiodinium natans]|uniref:Solute carrier family 40 protein n=1 Tax=Symbiodinium natans TaxID=878477 RepID=A0A812ST91_9DINO|nr:unnamed protein product [Symbiodinium natans]
MVGRVGTGLLFLAMVASALLAGPAVVKVLGSKPGLVVGLSLQAAFAVLFAFASQQPSGSALQWSSYLLGAVISGGGSGIAWTAQGTFFARTVTLLASVPPEASAASRPFDGTEVFTRTMSNPAENSFRRSPSPFMPGRFRRAVTIGTPWGRLGAESGDRSRDRALSLVTLRQDIFTSAVSVGSEPGVEEELQEDPSAITATLAGRFAAVLLIVDVLVKVLSGLLQGSFFQWHFLSSPLNLVTVLYALAALSATSAALSSALAEPKRQVSQALLRRASATPCQAVFAAVALWPSWKVWLLSFTNLAFGLSAGYMNGVVNTNLAAASPLFGEASIGTLMALTSLLASLLAWPLSKVSMYTGKGFVLGLGSLALAAIPLAVVWGQPNESNRYWGSWLLVLYALQGLGRSVYEGANRAVFADMFSEAESSGAFANCMMQSGLAFFTSFLLQVFLPGATCDVTVAAMVVGSSSMALPGYFVARRL